MEQRKDRVPECFRCHASILDGDLVMRDHGDWYHVRCVNLRRANGKTQGASNGQRSNGAAVAQNGAAVAQNGGGAVPGSGASESPVSAAPNSPPAVLCASCRTGVRPADLVMTEVGALHLRCRLVRT